jgi:hypothetical protein
VPKQIKFKKQYKPIKFGDGPDPGTVEGHRKAMAEAAAPRPLTEYLTVSDVAAILAVSDDTILKQFGSLDGVIDIGTPAEMHRRRKRVLRIPRRTLERYIAEKQVKVRRRA